MELSCRCRLFFIAVTFAAIFACVALAGPARLQAQDTDQEVSASDMELIREFENARIKVIEQVVGSVVAIYGPSRQGGGSGVIFDPSGLALTNHHVIEGAGLRGLGGLNDGKLYDWELVGTDPGGDVAIIQLKGREAFPWSPLGDSDAVKVGDWALAMGNPFLLAEDQVPTVTLGVVSGVERFQEGTGSQLVYGNCIQVDSSINPGNSGGPLFNMSGQIIGINGRGSFRDRGRVNVGLGYAISVNQIKNFLPDLLATKIVEHGTLDAAFSNRDGKVICSTLDLDSPVAKSGLELGDELLEFEGREITHANQFKNLLCTYPEYWPANLLIRKPDGQKLRINVRLFGLPYNFQPPPTKSPRQPGKQPDDQPEPNAPDNQALGKYLAREAGVPLNPDLNSKAVQLVLNKWQKTAADGPARSKMWLIEDEIYTGDERTGRQQIAVAPDGRFRVEWDNHDQHDLFIFDGQHFWKQAGENKFQKLDLVEAKMEPRITQVLAVSAVESNQPFAVFGQLMLDGSDKVAEDISYRMIVLDDDKDWFYAWFSLFDRHGKENVLLRKVSSDKNCSGENQGVIFDEFKLSEGVMVPRTKSGVRGLNEETVWTARTVSIESSEVDTTLFQKPEKTVNDR